MTAEPKARVTNTRYGLVNFTPVERILFFTIPGPKIPHSRKWHFQPGYGEKLFLKKFGRDVYYRQYCPVVDGRIGDFSVSNLGSAVKKIVYCVPRA